MKEAFEKMSFEELSEWICEHPGEEIEENLLRQIAVDKLKKLVQHKRLTEIIEYCIDNTGTGIDAGQVAEKLLEGGVIVPPIQLGQKVYRYDASFGTMEYVVDSVTVNNRSGLGFIYGSSCTIADTRIDSMEFLWEHIGKIVFLIEEDAKKAFEKR